MPHILTTRAVRNVMAADQTNAATPTPQRLAARVRELEDQLRRERSRSAGLEQGLTALSERLAELQAEAGTR